MRMPLSRNGGWLVLPLTLSVSCGSAAPPSSPTPAPVPITISTILISTRCLGPFHPGETVPAACLVNVGGDASPPVRAFADLRAFGGRADSQLVQCPACGPPPWAFDLDVRIPADAALGPQTVNVWVTDAQGRRAETTATFQVTAR